MAEKNVCINIQYEITTSLMTMKTTKSGKHQKFSREVREEILESNSLSLKTLSVIR